MKVIERDLVGRYKKDGLIYSIIREDGDSVSVKKWADENGYVLRTPEDISKSLYTRSLAISKAKKKKELIRSRTEDYKSDIISSDGLPFHANVETIIDVQMIIQMLENDTDVYEGYKCADGVRRNITKAQFQTALTEGAMRKSYVFAKEGQLIDLVDSVTTIEEVEAITW